MLARRNATRAAKRFLATDDPRYIKACQDRDAALKTLISFFKASEGSTLRAWLRYFDANSDLLVTFDEFCGGLAKLSFTGNAVSLFQRLDIDSNEVLSLDEIDPEAAKLWMRFRMWCVNKFKDPGDVLAQIQCSAQELERQQSGESGETQRPLTAGFRGITAPVFREGLQGLGWTWQHEDMLFDSMDFDGEHRLTVASFKWFAVDKRKQCRIDKATKSARAEKIHHAKERRKMAHELQDFKQHLRRRHHTCLRAWRRALDADGTMTVQKPELFKAAKDMHWHGDVRLLWKSLDKDGSGLTSLQELDLKSAEQLAKFKSFVDERFGGATAAFHAMDVHRKGKLKASEFITACKNHGFAHMSKAFFHGLDWEGRKYVTFESLSFLDSWKCPSYLTCKPNESAALNFKERLIQEYDCYVRAWKHLLDRDNSNRVAWEEFEAAAKRVGSVEDIPGAWRFFDDDISGFITLNEIDPNSFAILQVFKLWVDEVFGGARAAFAVLDENNAGQLTQWEFRKMCSSYGFQGNAVQVFQVLDADQSGHIASRDVAFLDGWDETTMPALDGAPDGGAAPDDAAPSTLLAPAPAPPIQLSARLLELARSPRQPPTALPALQTRDDAVASEAGLSQMSSLFKVRSMKKIYGGAACSQLPSVAQSADGDAVAPMALSSKRFWSSATRWTEEAIAPAIHSAKAKARRVKAMRNRILLEPVLQDAEAGDLPAQPEELGELAYLRQKTCALRTRTLELLRRADTCAEPGVEDVPEREPALQLPDVMQQRPALAGL
eukprot:TRINITY_DN13081_c2_g5_i1.p1 TRINITY_DN13081_c2_g5~~TRINITY_DN13081_c2_g5_i1.p1  ORF type:complete len:778 (-),score=191.98 TRINITY_DN13081_c2_g5_i1:19-2352(-)